MKYIEITIKLNRCAIEPALAALDMIGIDDAEVRDPHDAEEIMADKETYEWDYVDEKVAADIGKQPEIHIYREDESFVESVRGAMQKLKEQFDSGMYGEGQDPGELEVAAEMKDDSLWKDKWKEYFKPTHISDRIVVKPTWEEYKPASEEILIEIDPGMAFGTGTHETTSMCMKALEKYVKPGARVLDAGCGSGILSIAAAKLGAADVLGVDIDEEAVRVSEENFALNRTDGVCRAIVGDVTKGISYPAGGSSDSLEAGEENSAEGDAAGGENSAAGDAAGGENSAAGDADGGENSAAGDAAGGRYQADIVAANLMAELLCMISRGLADHLKQGGTLISSGILNEKEEMVRRAFESAGLRVTEVLRDGEWCCIMAEK